MKTTKAILAAILFLVMATLSVSAEETKESTPAKQNSDTVELKSQTLCPVMGGPIDSAAYTDIQGQRVYHCCAMCSSKLEANPDKFFKKSAEQGIIFENIQKTCPVTGKKLEEKTIYTDFEGRRIYFDTKECIKKFNADPQTYLKKMDAPVSTVNQVMDDKKNTKEKKSGTK